MEKNIRFCDKQHWLRLWRRLGVYSYDKTVYAYMDLLEHYNEPHRKYHNLEHINHCLAEFSSVWLLTKEPSVLELAIWYHDAIYDIGASDNEERSADLVASVMRSFSLPEDLIKRVCDIIIATKHNEIPESIDAKLMLDIDISNIGSADKFKETNRLVREEYSLTSDEVFKQGRSNILQSFLERPSVYLTKFFQEKYEKTARENILSSIKDLNSKMPVTQSSGWDYFYDLVKQNPGKRLSGFPFNEKFPKMYSGKKYQIILVSGIIIDAKVDDSREFMSEGLEWKTLDGNKSQSLVAAWNLLV